MAVLHILGAAVRATRLGIHVRFVFCNLSPEARSVLARSLQENASLTGFSCFGNPDGRDKDRKALKQAVIETRAPLQIWNNDKLPSDIVAERDLRSVEAAHTAVSLTTAVASPADVSATPAQTRPIAGAASQS